MVVSVGYIILKIAEFFLAVGRLSLIWSVFFTVPFPFPVTFVPLMEGGREGTNSKGCAGKVASHFQRIIPFGTDFG